MTISISNVRSIFDENYALKPQWLRANNFLSMIGVEQPTEAEFYGIENNGLPEREFEIFHAEFGSKFEVELAPTAQRAWKKFYEYSHEECLISDRSTQLFIWIPSHHEFYVVFGKKDLIRDMHENFEFISNRNFAEYIALNNFSSKQNLVLDSVYKIYRLAQDDDRW